MPSSEEMRHLKLSYILPRNLFNTPQHVDTTLPQRDLQIWVPHLSTTLHLPMLVVLRGLYVYKDWWCLLDLQIDPKFDQESDPTACSHAHNEILTQA